MARAPVRTITVGFDVEGRFREDVILQGATLADKAKLSLEERGYQVQTIRLCTQPFGDYLSQTDSQHALEYLHGLDSALKQTSIYTCAIGPLRAARWGEEGWLADLLPDILVDCTSLAATIDVLDGTSRPDPAACTTAAEITVEAASRCPTGVANLHFAAVANCPPNTPYFPAAYHRGPRCLSVGLESAALVHAAFKKARGMEDAEQRLTEVLSTYCGALEEALREIADALGLEYAGIDLSTAPGKEASIADAVELLGFGPFGQPGTLSVLKIITNALARVPAKRCGYSGLMLPVLEDAGLALRNAQGYFDVQSLMAYSAVCGTGLDTIPIPGDSDPAVIAALILDVASLAARLHKPLSVRLFPVQGSRVGEITSFQHRVLVNSAVMSLSSHG